MRVGIPIADLYAGSFAQIGVLTALLERNQSGEGQWVQTSLLQSQIFMLDFQAARWLTRGEIPRQAGNDHPTSIPTGVFPTTNGSINIACAGEAIWQRCAKALGHPDWIDDPRFLQNADRSKSKNPQRTHCRNYDDEYIGALGGSLCLRLECRPDPFIRSIKFSQIHRSSIWELLPRHSGLSRLVIHSLQLGQPFSMNRTPSSIVSPPPSRGQHTEDILAELGVVTQVPQTK